MSDYIDPADATHIRVFRAADEEWNIDAADDDGGYTEVCWDHRFIVDADGGQVWEPIPTCKAALELVDLFAAEVAPHLTGTKPKVTGLRTRDVVNA